MKRLPWIFVLLIVPTITFAHSGATDSRGGHRCETNCERHNMRPKQYHFHTATMDETQLKRYNRFRNNLCDRVRNRFARSPQAFERVNTRIENRFGYTCGGAGSAPRETGPELRKRLAGPSTVRQDPKADRVTVNRVIDGDTIEVRIGTSRKETVRLIGIDAPEVEGYGDDSQCYAGEAFVFLRNLLGRNRVELVPQPGDNRDKYGRLLRYVEFRGRDVSLQLLTEGYAKFYPWFEHPRSQEYAQGEIEAQKESRGLWQACR